MGYCGLSCAECGAYLVYQADDIEFRRDMADHCLLAGVSLKAEDYGCSGCKSDLSLFESSRDCRVRACAVLHRIEECFLCDDYPCSLLEDLFFGQESDDSPLIVIEKREIIDYER